MGVVMRPSCRKSKGGLSEIWCCAVRTQYKRAILQIAPLLHIDTND